MIKIYVLNYKFWMWDCLEENGFFE